MQDHPILTPLHASLNALNDAIFEAQQNPEFIQVPDKIFDLVHELEESNDALRRAIVAHLTEKA